MKIISLFLFLQTAAFASTLETLQRSATQARTQGDALEQKLQAQMPPGDLDTHQPGFKALERIFTRALGTELQIDIQEVLKHSGLLRTARGTWASLTPVDPVRPGVVVTFDEGSRAEVDAVVAEMRGATTVALMGRGFFNAKKMRELRANSFLIVRGAQEFEAVLEQSRARLAELPALFAGSAYRQAVAQGAGPFLTAEQRLVRALSGGLGWRKLQSELSAGITQARGKAREIRQAVEKLVGWRVRQIAFSTAEEIWRHGVEVGKPVELLGVEFDLENKREIGIEYLVPTQDGPVLTIRKVGRDFQVPGAQVLEAKPYAKMNVAVLTEYEKSKGLSYDQARTLLNDRAIEFDEIRP